MLELHISEHENNWLTLQGKQLLNELGIALGHSVIDFGCGQGRYTVPLSQSVGNNGKVFAIERKGDAVEIAQAKLSKFSGIDNTLFLLTDSLTNVAAIDNLSINAVLLFDVLQHITNKTHLFDSLLKLLKPSALIHVYPAAIPHPNSVDMDEIIEILQKKQMKLLRVKPFLLMHSVDLITDSVYSFSKI